MDKRAVLFVNGELQHPGGVESLLREGDYLIAVDGGLNHILGLNRIPHLLMGDLDSVSGEDVERMRRQGVEIQRFPTEKNETDLELALLTAAKNGFTEIVLIGALGGRLDQTLGNLFLLLLPELVGLQVILSDGFEEVFLIRNSAVITGSKGDIVSLIPFTGQVTGVLTHNLQYPLQNETLLIQNTRGISNVMLESTAEVSIKSGCLLCIHTRRLTVQENL